MEARVPYISHQLQLRATLYVRAIVLPDGTMMAPDVSPVVCRQEAQSQCVQFTITHTAIV
jgi:hypothetical protein